MEKKRIYLIDNIKALLITLVVIGHLLVLFIEIPKVKTIYLMIYSFHMPIFIFISGFLYKRKPKKILKIFIKYAVFQVIYSLVSIYILKEETQTLSTIILEPYWIMWFLFSLGSWYAIMYILNPQTKKEYTITLIYSIILSLAVGYIDKVGYEFSLSRTIVFFPYFVLGSLIRNHYDIEEINQKKDNKLLVAIIVCLIDILLILLYYKQIPSFAFYGSLPYWFTKSKPIFRLLTYVIASAWIMVFVKLMPNKKYLVSKVGQKTEYIYLLHGFGIVALIVYLQTVGI